MRKQLLLSKNVKCIESKNCRLEFSQTLIACLSFACIVNTSIYRACYSEVVWQNVRVKDLFEVASGLALGLDQLGHRLGPYWRKAQNFGGKISRTPKELSNARDNTTLNTWVLQIE